MRFFSAIFILFIVFLSHASFARDKDCTLQLEGLQPAFDTSIDGVTVINPPVLDKEGGHLSEKIETGNGQRISFQTGGCVHYGFSLTYENIGDFTGENLSELIAKAKALLKETPFNQSFATNIDGLLPSFDEAEERKIYFSPGNLIFSCGDATCSVEVKDQKLTIGYDFPL